MIESYAVGVTLTLNSNAERVLNRDIAKFQRLDVVLKSATAKAKAYDAAMASLGTATGSVDKLARAMERLDKARSGAGSSNRAMTDMANEAQRLLGITAQLSITMRANALLAAQTAQAMQASATAQQRATAAAQAGARVAPPRPGALPAAGYGYGHHGYHGSYAMQGGGQRLVEAGVAPLQAMMEPAQLRRVIMTDTRITPEIEKQIFAGIEEVSKQAPNLSQSSILRAFLVAKNQFGMDADGTFKTTMDSLPALFRSTGVIQTFDRARGGSGDQATAMVKALDMLGSATEGYIDDKGFNQQRFNRETYERQMAKMTRNYVATQGAADPRAMLGFVKQARVAGMLLSEEFIFDKAPSMIDAMGGHRFGTFLSSAQSVFQGGVLTAKNHAKMVEAGLAAPGTYRNVRNPRTGRVQRKFVPGPIYDLDILSTDPHEFSIRSQRRMNAAGLKTERQQLLALASLGQRATVGGGLGDILKSLIEIETARKNLVNTRLNDLPEFFSEHDPTAKVQQVQASWNKLMVVMGDAGADRMIQVLDSTTAGLTRLSTWAKENPDASEKVIAVGLGLGVVVTGLGALSTAILVLTPALRLLGLASSGAAAGAAGAAAGGGALGLASRMAMGGPASLAVGGAGLLALGSSYETPATRAAQDSLARARRFDPMASPSDGFGVDGRSLTAPPVRASEMQVNLHGDFNADGRKIGEIAAQGIARGVGGPSRGTTGADMRISPFGGN